MRVKFGLLVIMAAVLLWIGAVCSPSWLHKDRDLGLTSLEAAVLKTEASHNAEVPAAWLQITEATSRSSSSDRDSQFRPDGTVVWYGPFGIEYGRSEIRSGYTVRSGVDAEGLFGAWILLFMLELALMGIAVFCFSPLIRRHWPKIERVVSGWERRHF